MEALVSMLILSLFFLASSRAITQKQTVEIQKNPHGYFECYISGDDTWQHLSISNVYTKPVLANSGCKFNPPTGVNFFNVHYFDGSQYYNSQQVIFNKSITLNGPSGIDIPGLFDKDDENSEEELTTEQLQLIAAQIMEFKVYLKMTHSSSEIYSIWEATGEPPAQAAMIAW